MHVGGMGSIVRRMARGVKHKEFRTFLLFLLLSFLVWHIERLRQTYTITTRLNIECEDIPQGYTTHRRMSRSVAATLEGNGFSLLKMFMMDSRNIHVSVASLRRAADGEGQWAVYAPRRLARSVTDLPESVRIVDILTDTVMIPLLTVHQRRLPVRVRDDVALSPQRTLSAPRLVRPDSVTVTATSDILDTMTAVYTVRQAPMTIADTTVSTLALQIPPTATADAASATVEYDVEPFTEKKLSVPIRGVNLPRGYSCRLFPPSAKVTFSVGLSRFAEADAKAFGVEADFDAIRPGTKASRVRVSLTQAPDFSHNVSFSPSFAEFILEKN